MIQSRRTLPKEYDVTELNSVLDLPSVADDPQTMHLAFATALYDLDRKADLCQSLKPEILTALGQIWVGVQRSQGVLVSVSQGAHGVSVDVTDPTDERAPSTKPKQPGESEYDTRLQSIPDHDVSLAEFERDMNRLSDLRQKYSYPGLNSAESSEVEDLREKYGLSFTEWYQQEYLQQSN
jgi:hypothetical protein